MRKIPQKDRARSCQSEKRGSKPRHICITHHIGSTPPPPGGSRLLDLASHAVHQGCAEPFQDGLPGRYPPSSGLPACQWMTGTGVGADAAGRSSTLHWWSALTPLGRGHGVHPQRGRGREGRGGRGAWDTSRDLPIPTLGCKCIGSLQCHGPCQSWASPASMLPPGGSGGSPGQHLQARHSYGQSAQVGSHLKGPCH